MAELKRLSPVTLPGSPARTVSLDGWSVVEAYEDQGLGPWLVDLSHVTKYDLQSADLGAYRPYGLAVPEVPGQSAHGDGVVVNRMNRTQASIWVLGQPQGPAPAEPAYTETTEVQALLALKGKDVFAIAEGLSRLDLTPPAKEPPFLVQGPAVHVPMQMVVLERDGRDGTLLLAFSRGYGADVAHAILETGEPWHLTPGGYGVM